MSILAKTQMLAYRRKDYLWCRYEISGKQFQQDLLCVCRQFLHKPKLVRLVQQWRLCNWNYENKLEELSFELSKIRDKKRSRGTSIFRHYGP